MDNTKPIYLHLWQGIIQIKIADLESHSQWIFIIQFSLPFEKSLHGRKFKFPKSFSHDCLSYRQVLIHTYLLISKM